MVGELLKCFAVGICASAPIGPVAIQVIQRSLAYGSKAGFVSGLGAATVDTTYALASIFFLGLFQEFIDGHTRLIMILGGVLLALIGSVILLGNPFKEGKKRKKVSPSFYFQTLLSALSNPAALVVMFALISLFGIEDAASHPWVLLDVLFVALGTVSWWFSISWLVSKLCDRFNIRILLILSRIAGAAIAVFGVVLFFKALI